MKFLTFILLFAAVSAEAKIYFDEVNHQAVIYVSQEANVNALFCDNVTENELRTVLKSVKESAKCNLLSESGLSKKDIELKLSELKNNLNKNNLNKTLEDIPELVDSLGAATGDKDISMTISNIFKNLLETRRKEIANLTPDQIFQQYQLDARIPTLQKVSSEYLETEIKQFVLLTQK